jgi:hypothetical protein
VATFETSLLIRRPLAPTFDFVTDFRNAPRWDPRTYDANKVTPGPVGAGTRFLLLGGMFSRETLDRLRVPDWLRPTTELPYEVVSFVAPSEMVVRGETRTLRYEDRLTFSEEAGGTRLHYWATMELKGVLAVGEPIFQPIFRAIGADATRGMPAAVEAAVPDDHSAPAPAPAPDPAPAPPVLPLPGSPIVTPDDVRRVVALEEQAFLRNLLITQGYHDVSKTILTRTGGADMNWCTLGSWASKTAGTFIRDEEVPAVFRKLLEGKGPLRPAFEELQRKLNPGQDPRAPKLIDVINQILRDCSTYIMVGNKVVYAELAQCCASFVHALGADTAPDPAKLAAFQAQYTEGDPQPDEVEWTPERTLRYRARGGQGLLRGMTGNLYRAMFEADPKRRAERILLANAQGGLHEQTRLQPYIAGGIDAPIENTLVAWAHAHVDRSMPEASRGPLHAVVDAAMPALGRMIKEAWQDFSTDALMTLTLPDTVLHLGHPIPADPGAPLVPPLLETIADPELAAVLAKYDALEIRIEKSRFSKLKDRIRSLFGESPVSGGELADVGAMNWTDFDQRMRYILTLFRLRQQDAHLFQQPFTDAQRAAMFAGTVPPGPL